MVSPPAAPVRARRRSRPPGAGRQWKRPFEFPILDTQTRVVMQEILTNIWQQFRISVLFVTHDIEESIFLSDRIYVMTARPGDARAATSGNRIWLPGAHTTCAADGAP